MDLTITPRPDRPASAGGADGGAAPLPAPSRRLLPLGVGTLGAGLALGTGAADAAGPTLRKGDRGSAVTALQKRLNALRYWCGTPDGSFGHLTQQAVFAVQKAAGLGRDGVVGARTWGALDAGKQPSRRITSGSGFEVDLSRQLLILTGGGRIACILNTSTGSGERYYSGGRWKTATTPKGDFRMYRGLPAGAGLVPHRPAGADPLRHGPDHGSSEPPAAPRPPAGAQRRPGTAAFTSPARFPRRLRALRARSAPCHALRSGGAQPRRRVAARTWQPSESEGPPWGSWIGSSAASTAA